MSIPTAASASASSAFASSSSPCFSIRFHLPFPHSSLPHISVPPTKCFTPISAASPPPDPAVVEAAWEILDNYNQNDVKCLDQPSLLSSESLFALGASVVVAVEAVLAHDGQQPLLGICASNTGEAVTALRQWTRAIGCEFFMPEILNSSHDSKTIPGPVYVKYNPQSKISYVQSYNGKFRGVIVQIGQKQVGHLPLSLFNQNAFVQSPEAHEADGMVEDMMEI